MPHPYQGCYALKTTITSAVVLLVAFSAIHLMSAGQSTKLAKRKVKVTIRDAKPIVVQPVLPVDATTRIRLIWGTAMAFSPYVDNKRLVFSRSGGIRTTFKIDGRIINPVGPINVNRVGRFLVTRAPLPQRTGRRKRQGWKTVFVTDNIHITQTVELVPTKPAGKIRPGQKRKIDAALVRYFIENKGNRSHTIGMRLATDTLLVNNDGCLWAAPNQPGKILNGVVISKKMIPKYLKVLQNNNLQNPGYTSHWTFDLGGGRPKPTRIVLTRHGQEYTQWEVRAVRAAGDTGMAIFWDPREVKAKRKVEFAYAYGEGLASSPDGDGKVGLVLGGSFEPGKLFSIRAYVQDPLEGQWLHLVLPPGMKLVEGKSIQPVPQPSELGNSLVLWKARVLRLGNFDLRVRSNSGATQTKRITIDRGK